MSILNNLFSNIYVLYIKESEVLSIKKVLSEMNVNVTYFLGVNGYLVNTPNINIKKGEYGHISSFINILKDAKQHNYPNILILEPDIYFCKNFDKILESYKEIISTYDLLYLGCTQNKYYSETTWNKISIINNKYYKAHKTLGTFAVSISNTIYDILLSLLTTYSAPTDVLFTKIQDSYKSIVLYPNLISCNVVQSGTKGIQNYRNQVKFSMTTRWNLREYNYINYYDFSLEPNTYILEIIINSKMKDYMIEVNSKNINFNIINLDHLIFSKKDKIYSKRILSDNIKYNIYVKLSDSFITIKTTNIFIDNIIPRKVNITSNLFNEVYIKNNLRYSVMSYYKELIDSV